MGEAAEFQAQPALVPHLKKEMEISDLRLAASLGNGWKSFLPISTPGLKNKSISYQSLAGNAAGREWQQFKGANGSREMPSRCARQGLAHNKVIHLEFLPFPPPQGLASP